MSVGQTLYLPARAKLNLVLRIVGRRDDGYHLLDTLFHTLALHDDVAVQRVGSGLHISVAAEDEQLMVPADERNLAIKALGLLQQELGDVAGFHVRLHKRIPNGGGLGGGSSNAAAALRLGNRLLGDPLDMAALARIAARLGADVPFFLRGGSQWGRGIGDELLAVPVAARHFVLLVPPYGCETAAVYKIHADLWQPKDLGARVPAITVPKNWNAAVGIRYVNELERAAEQLRPELGRLRLAVTAAGSAQVRMSGSGSTLFVSSAEAALAQQCRRDLGRALADTEHREVAFVVTASGPKIDADQPSPQIPSTVRSNMPECGPPEGAG